ncbi:cupin domain-containing protein [Halomonas cupida]|uniref:Cupin n=1 Tax=Halomonas cupida TaxID=44933 RepID=A0A1M6ZHW6_9GAMM|nr:cupin domain-containing protein [Halomonas cupida]GEN24359.1 cupin [Halomonas cupida]SHL29984.1 Cupin domain-containing protein [Halomonas cupida]
MTAPRPSATPTVQIDDERCIVTRWDFPPGAETGWHRHGHDYVVIPLTPGTMLLETPDGEQQATLTPGVSYRRPVGVEHNVINAGSESFAFIEVEMKA